MTDMKKIEELVQEELKEANEIHPAFASDHEAYAVILEELEECEEELAACKRQLGAIWEQTKQDIENHGLYMHLKEYAKRLAAEAIQLAAMADKAM